MRRNLLLLSLLTLALIVFSSCSPSKTESNSTTEAKQSASTENTTADLPELKVGMECAYAPYNWTQLDDSNGAVQIQGSNEYAGGYDVEIAKIIAEKLGRKLVIVKTEWDGLIPSVNSGIIDVIIAGMTETPERAKAIDFSKSYYTTDLILITTKDGKYANAKTLADFKGAKVTGQLGTLHYDVIDQIPDVDKQEALPDFPSMRVALASGIIDAYVSEKGEGKSVASVNENFLPAYFKKGEGFSVDKPLTTSVGIKKGSELLADINKIIEGISLEQQEEMFANVLKNQPSNQ